MATTGPRDPDEIEREIEQTREGIDATVEEIGERLAPRRLVNEAADYARATVARGASTVGTRASELARENAIPLTLIGTGLVWLMATRSRRPSWPTDNRPRGWSQYDESDRVTTEPHVGGGIGEYAGEWMTRAASEARSVGHEAVQRGAEIGGRVQDEVRYRTERLRERADEMRYEQPLLLGLASMALGALIGGAMPSTRREDDLLGETRDRLVETAAEKSREKVEEARRLAEEKLSDEPEREPHDEEPLHQEHHSPPA
jgi:Protein of unknown function (DUF3618)